MWVGRSDGGGDASRLTTAPSGLSVCSYLARWQNTQNVRPKEKVEGGHVVGGGGSQDGNGAHWGEENHFTTNPTFPTIINQ